MREFEPSGSTAGKIAFSKTLRSSVQIGVQMGEGGRGRGIGKVVGGHVDGLHRRDRALLGGGDALFELAHVGAQRRLVADGAGHAAEQRGDLRVGLHEAENVVDEEDDVLAFLVAEIFGDGDAGQRDAGARAGRFVHLAVHQRGFRDDARLGQLAIEVVALARALADAGEHRHAAVLLGDVVDEFENRDGLADAGAAEQTDLAAACERADEIEDLDAGLEDFRLGGLVGERRRVAMYRHQRSCPGWARARRWQRRSRS